MSSSRLHRLLALAPPAYVLTLVALLGVDVPWNDQWSFVPAVARLFTHELRFADVWAPHNEHRLVVPKLLMLLLARLSHWNIRLELVAIFVLALATLVVLTAALRSLARAAPSSWELPLVSLLVFSLAQKENWLWGWQIAIALDHAAVVTGLWLLARRKGRLDVALALACGVVATFSFANGLLCWPVGALVLLAQRRRLALVAWLATALIAIAAYFHGWTAPPQHALATIVAHPLAYPAWVLAYLGSPLAQIHWTLALVVGGLGLALVAMLVRALAPRVGLAALTFPLALAGYATLGALMTAIGRVGFGLDSALWSRYTTFSTDLWLADVLLLGWHLRLAERPAPRRGSIAAALTIVALTLLSQLRGTQYAVGDYHTRLQARAALRGDLATTPDTLLPRELLQQQRATLQQLHLSAFRE